MLIALDVAYGDGPGKPAHAAGVLFADWKAVRPLRALRVEVAAVASYAPGAFFERELPCLLKVLREVREAPAIAIVDGYVWLADSRPGLGAHLHEALGRSTVVVGVAKTPFKGDTWSAAVIRGHSTRPLRITAAGMDQDVAARHIATMRGPHRLPDMLRLADRMARGLIADVA